MKMNIVWLYPDILNLHGDRGNVMALSKITEAMGIDAQIIKVHSYREKPDFSDVDMVFMGAVQLRDVEHVVQDMSHYADEFKAYVEAGGFVLATGSTGCILGNKLTMDDGEVVKGLGIMNLSATELSRTRMPYVTREVYGDDIWWTYKDMEIIGCQIQRVDYKLEGIEPLGQLVYGYGNCLDGTEGARYKNVFVTNTVGPLLSANPWFGADIIKEIMNKNGEEVSDNLEKLEYLCYAREAVELKKKFIQDKFKLPGITHNGC